MYQNNIYLQKNEINLCHKFILSGWHEIGMSENFICAATDLISASLKEQIYLRNNILLKLK